MSSPGPVVADTHVFLWYINASPRLAESSRLLLDDVTAAGAPIFVSSVTIVELRYLAEKGTLTESDVDAVHALFDAVGTGYRLRSCTSERRNRMGRGSSAA